MPMPRGKKINYAYATVSDDYESANYRTISKVMSEQGFKMNCVKIDNHEIGVDTIEDYNYLKKKYEN